MYIYIFQKRDFFVINLASEGHLLVGKFPFTGGEFRGAGEENPHQFISQTRAPQSGVNARLLCIS